MVSTWSHHARGKPPLIETMAATAQVGCSGALGFGTVFFQAPHDLDQVAGPVTVVELVAQDALPGALAGAGRPGQTEDVGTARQSVSGARLDGGGRHLLKRDHVKDRRKAFDLLFEQRLD